MLQAPLCDFPSSNWSWKYICETGCFDWSIENGSLKDDNNGLYDAVVMQLYTDKRSPDEADKHVENGGWWGDYYHEKQYGFEIGSRLWTLARAPLNNDTLVRYKLYVEEALEPLLQQGAFADYSVTVEKKGQSIISDIKLFANNGETVFNREFKPFWDNCKTVDCGCGC